MSWCRESVLVSVSVSGSVKGSPDVGVGTNQSVTVCVDLHSPATDRRRCCTDLCCSVPVSDVLGPMI